MYAGGENEVVSKGEWGIGLPSIVLKRGEGYPVGDYWRKHGDPALPEVTILYNKIEQIRVAICCTMY